MIKQVTYLLAITALAFSLQACAPKLYVVDSPEPSAYTYVPADSQDGFRLSFVDERDDRYIPFTSGVLAMGLSHEGEAIDPIWSRNWPPRSMQFYLVNLRRIRRYRI